MCHPTSKPHKGCHRLAHPEFVHSIVQPDESSQIQQILPKLCVSILSMPFTSSIVTSSSMYSPDIQIACKENKKRRVSIHLRNQLMQTYARKVYPVIWTPSKYSFECTTLHWANMARHPACAYFAFARIAFPRSRIHFIIFTHVATFVHSYVASAAHCQILSITIFKAHLAKAGVFQSRK